MAFGPSDAYRRAMKRTGWVAAVALVATAGLSGCGDDETCSSSPPAGFSAPAADGGCGPAPRGDEDANEADEDFVVDHALSVAEVNALAELAIEKYNDVSATSLAEVYALQASGLLDDLQDWEEAWDLEPAVYDSAASTSLSVVPQYSGDEEYEALEDLSGKEFEENWVEVMLERTDEQISAAEDILEEGSHPELRAAAQQWLAANTAFLDGLEDLANDHL